MKLRRRYFIFPLVVVGVLIWWALTPAILHTPEAPATPTPEPTAVPSPTPAPALLPHDPTAFTQGLVWLDGWLYEATGLYGQSSLRKVNPATGEVVARVDLADTYFGEGLAAVDGRLIWLTWREQTAFVYDLEFNLLETLSYEGEGWGLCYDPQSQLLVMSNGSDVLTLREPGTLAAVATLSVTRAGQPVYDLNELECVDGFVYANVWRSDEILQIDQQTGVVTAAFDTTDWLTAEQRAQLGNATEDVLNGIAHDPATGNFYITGKRWPWLFRTPTLTFNEQ